MGIRRLPVVIQRHSMKHRLERVKEVIKRDLSEIIQRELTFRATLVTVQDVDVTPDLKQAFVYVSAIGTEVDRNAAIATLTSHRTLLQHQLSKRVILKYTPHLTFRLDTSIERGTRVIELLDSIAIPETPDEE